MKKQHRTTALLPDFVFYFIDLLSRIMKKEQKQTHLKLYNKTRKQI